MSEQVETLQAMIEKLRLDRDRANRTAIDRLYMMEALTQMLGPKGREVWRMWNSKRVTRIHTSWREKAAELSGEEVAQVHLDMEAAIETAVPFDFDDSTITKDQPHAS